jgi:hypothetical protein
MPRPGGHPLRAAAGDEPVVAAAVAVAHPALEHHGHRLEAAVRVIGEAAHAGGGVVGVDAIEEDERVEVAERRLPDGAREVHARALDGGRAGQRLHDASLRDAHDGGGA